ncbi:MAG: Aspartyl-tRNA(Asn) amidotransferase subunit [Myxococcales bacterium]|nr:Aspartyl-tRNA(Asn) amidotransferase subunit [Myxococcales bacterium]
MTITDGGLAEVAQAIRARQVSAAEVTDAYLARIAAIDGTLKCFYRVDEAGARAQARAVDERLARGEDPGLLAGVPVGLKDLFVTEGLETTAGSKILEGWIPPYDGTPSKKLKQAGAVLVGKLSMDEFAMGSSNENSAYGPVRNPWDTTRVPGGSSGGSAAAVAAGLVAGALGTDTGGSIRQPAALTGTTGLKPTYGRVSRYGVVAFASSLDQVGPFGRSALDCAYLLQAIAGHDAHDATSLGSPVPDYLAACARPIDGLRVGIVRSWVAKLDRELAALVEEAFNTLERLGARLVDVTLPTSEHGIAAYYIIATAEASSNLARYDGVRYGLRVPGENLNAMYARTRSAGFGDEVKRRIMLGTYALRSGYYDAYYLRAQKVRTLIRNEFARAFGAVDVIATPTAPSVAFKLGEKTDDPLAMYLNDVFTIPCNLAGIPGMSVPCGFSQSLPVGLQLLGPALGEETLFAVAGAYQRATDWHTRRPPA